VSKSVNVWTDPGRCSTCKHCSMDMDMNPFCTHAEVTRYHRWGLNLSKAIAEFCGENLKLREPKQEEGGEKIDG
jgi:predicted metal-binding protein